MHPRLSLLHLDTLDEPQLARLSDLLDPAEREQAGRFVFAVNRREYIAAHGLLRCLLAEETGLDAASLRFSRAGRGAKPRLDGPEGQGLDFNISHTKGLVVCALLRGGELGVDAEHLGRSLDLALARRFFAADEAEWLEGQANAAQAFVQLWTLKEALVKAVGQGIAMGLGDFSVRPDPPRLLRVDTPLLGRLQQWRLWQPPPGAGPASEHSLALAWRGGESGAGPGAEPQIISPWSLL
jgi:4'-phosphopantetheinyl transferase